MTSPVVKAKGVVFPDETDRTVSRVVPIPISIARFVLMAALLLAPLAFGAVLIWAWTVLAVIAALLLLFWAMGSVRQRAIKIYWSPLYIPAALFLVLGIVQYSANLSRDPYATWESLIQLVTDLVFFFLAGQLWRGASKSTWRRFGLVVTAYAFLMALFAIIQFFSSHGLIYWSVETQGSTFGPYVNRNDYAGLMEMLIPIATAYALSESQPRHDRALLGFAVVVPICSVLLSGSRGGFIALLVESSILMVALNRQSNGPTRRNFGMLIGLGAVAIVLLFFWLAPTYIPKRLATVAGVTHSPEVTLGERWVVWKDSFGIVRDRPWVGSGLGSFAVVFPQHQSFASDLVWDHAHNDYVEALADSGIAGGLLILAALAIFFRSAFGNLRERLPAADGLIQLGAAVGCCGLLVQSLVDFNLHIPANAAWFAVCLGISTSWIHGGACHQGG